MNAKIHRSRRLPWRLAWVFVIGLGLSGALLYQGQNVSASAPQNPPALSKGGAELPAFASVVKEVRPSVVNIKAVKQVHPAKGESFQSFPGVPDQLRKFFDEGMGPRGFQFNLPENGMPAEGLGSGLVVSKDGYILTNNHVVKDADEITVTLSDGKEHRAKVVGRDDKSDLALLKIDSKDLKAATFADSDASQVGEWVLAMGSPFGLSETVTAGIISAKGRNNVGIADYEDFIQTDAEINPGNSGGPLVNMKGEVVGINTAIFSRSGGSQGIGFAIPAKIAQSVTQSLMEHGKVTRGYLGVNIQNMTEDLAKSFGVAGTEGVLVADVKAGSPAEKAGIQSGDVITRLDNKPVGNVVKLRNTVASMEPGVAVPLEVLRNTKSMTLTLTLGELPGAGSAAESSDSGGPSSKFGFSFEEINPSIAEQMGVKVTAGVVVTNVEPGGAAEQSGLRAGDVIVAAARKPVKSLSDLRAALNSHDPQDGILLQVLTGDTHRFVIIKQKTRE